MDPEMKDRRLYGDEEELDYSEPAVLPEDAGRADWHLRKARVADAKVEEITALFEEEISRLRDRLEEARKPWVDAGKWHRKAVEAWHRHAFAKDPKGTGKTVKLPSGTSVLRAAPQPMSEIVDEDALRAWCSMQELPESMRGPRMRTFEDAVYPVKEPEFRISVLKKLIELKGKKDAEPGSVIPAVLAGTGEQVPGIRFRALPDNHDLKEG